MKRFFYSLFFRHFCVSSSPTHYSKNTFQGVGLEETSHYSDFKDGLLENGENPFLAEKSLFFLPESQIFILEKANFKILAHFQKISISEDSNPYKIISEDEYFEENPLILQFFTNSEASLNLLNNESLFVVEILCPELFSPENAPSKEHKNLATFNIEKILGSAWVKFARKMDMFFLDLSFLVKTSEAEFLKRISRIMKMGLRICSSILVLIPCALISEVADFAEIFDNMFIEDSFFNVHRSYLCEIQRIDENGKPKFYIIKYGENSRFKEQDQILYLLQHLKLEKDEAFLPKDYEKIVYNLMLRVGLRKAVHFFSQSQYEFDSLKDSLPGLTLAAVFIRILYNEKLLSHQEISKFRYFLQNFSFAEQKPIERNTFRLSFVPLKLSTSQMSDASIENEINELKGSKESFSKQSPPKGGLLKSIDSQKIQEESKLSPKRLMKLGLSKNKGNKNNKKGLEDIEEYVLADKVLMVPTETNESKSSGSWYKRQKSQRLLKSKQSFIKVITPKSINREISFSWGKNNELCYSNYTLESGEKSPLKEDEKDNFKRSFVKNEGLLLVRQHSL